MDKRKFASDFMRIRYANDWNLYECGEKLRVSHQTISNWEDPANPITPLPKRWELIKEVMGIDVEDYMDKPTVNVTGDASQGIVATNGSSVTVSTGGGNVDLDEFEMRIYTLWKKYGSKAMGEQCLKNLLALAAFHGV